MSTKTPKAKRAAPKQLAKKPASHQFKLRIKTDLYERFEEKAAARGVSLASVMISATAKEFGLA
jgi:predicted HicB family RNase H-like nuclease